MIFLPVLAKLATSVNKYMSVSLYEIERRDLFLLYFSHAIEQIDRIFIGSNDAS